MTRQCSSLVLALALVVVPACNRSGSPPAAAAEPDARAPIPVTIAAVTVQPSARLVNFVGTLYGNEEVTLSSQVEGQIKALTVDLGDTVQAGQVVAQIDDDQLQARLRETEAMLAKAQADEARGRAARRAPGHLAAGIREHEDARRGRPGAARHPDGNHPAHARRLADHRCGGAARGVGRRVRPAGQPLFSLVAEDPVKLRGDVPERYANELQVGQTVQIHVDAFPTAVFEGRLARISPASNPQNRSVGVEVLVANPERRLKPGFYANGAVVTRTDDRALMIPQDALITFAGVTKVFVVHDAVARQREVRPGSRGTGGLVEITDGLAPDEQVATSGSEPPRGWRRGRGPTADAAPTPTPMIHGTVR